MGRKTHSGAVGAGKVQKFPNVDVAASTSADVNKTYWCDTSAGGLTLTLPSVPSKGDIVRIFDAGYTFDTNNLTVARNGQLVMGLDEDLTVNTQGAAFDLVYYNASRGWRIYTT
jgi:hypothetical protein